MMVMIMMMKMMTTTKLQFVFKKDVASLTVVTLKLYNTSYMKFVSPVWWSPQNL
jgi:hypothetical protein